MSNRLERGNYCRQEDKGCDIIQVKNDEDMTSGNGSNNFNEWTKSTDNKDEELYRH